MSLKLGTVAPDFKQDSTHGEIAFHEWKGESWCVFFSHPADFTPVCTTELGTVARLKPSFDKRGCKVLALSVDPVESHNGWVKDINETQNVEMNYPIIADADQSVAKAYGMIHPDANEKLTVRSVFFIDGQHKVRATLTYPPATGRNFAEILRVLDGLQLTDSHQVATPANWQDGDDVVIVPSLKDEDELKAKFPKGYKEVKPYLRVTPQPNK
ncbi:MAG: peroxiredoxin [Myxococcota bacterium]